MVNFSIFVETSIMKTSRLLLLLLICNAFILKAQDAAQAPQKDIVVVDLFARNRTVPMAYAEDVRQQVMAAFADRGRQIVVDAATSGALAQPQGNWGFVDPTTAAANRNEFLQNRMQVMRDAGARYVVTGAIADYKFEHITLPAVGKNPPTPGFRATFQVIISAYDLKTGKQIPDRLCTLKADARVAEDADKMAISTLRGQLLFYIDNSFKFETTILQLGDADSRKGVREVYIHSGSDMGVRNGDLFLVYEEIPIGGVFTRQNIGKLRVNDVENPSVAKCKITKGNDEIVKAFNEGRVLICISDGQALF